MKQRKQAKRASRTVWALAAACVAALIALIVVAVAPWQNRETVTGQFVPPPFEPMAQTGVPQVEEALGWSEVAAREGYTVWVCGVLNADSDGTLPVWFYYHRDNDTWVKLRVLDEKGNRLGETGLLRPGEYVESVQLTQEAASGAVKLHIMGYEPETYFSAGALDFQTYLNVPQ